MSCLTSQYSPYKFHNQTSSKLCRKCYHVIWWLDFFCWIDKSCYRCFENVCHDLTFNSSNTTSTYACVKVRWKTTLRYRVRWPARAPLLVCTKCYAQNLQLWNSDLSLCTHILQPKILYLKMVKLEIKIKLFLGQWVYKLEYQFSKLRSILL